MSQSSQLIDTSPTLVDRSIEKELQNQFQQIDAVPRSAEEFLNQITCTVNTEDIYSIQRVFYLQEGTHTANDYVCLVLKVQVSEMISFYGGQYLFQLWKNKERLFQFVHSTPIMNNFYCSNTELCYMVEGNSESDSFIQLVKPYKQQFYRILCPFSSSKEVKLFVNNEVLLMAQKRTLKAIILKDLVNHDKTSYYFEETQSNFSINSTNQSKEVTQTMKDSILSRFETIKLSNTAVFGLSSQMRKKPSPITVHQDQILLEFNILGIDFDICENQASQVGLVAAGSQELVYFTVNYKNSNTVRLERVENKYGWQDVKSRCFWDDRYVNLIMRRLNPQQKLFAFQSEKGFVDFYINMKEMISSTRVYANYAGRKNAEQAAAASAQNSLNLENFSLLREIQVGTEAIYGTLINGESFIHTISGHLQRLDLTNSYSSKSIPVGILNEKFIKRHIKIFQDLSLLNDIAVFTHGQLISVFELSRKTWAHHSQSGVAINHYNKTSQDKHYNLCYFGYSQSELMQAKIVSTNSDSVCEIICEDRQGQIRKYCYFSKGRKKTSDTIQVQPLLLEQKVQSTFTFDGPIQTMSVQGSSESYREFGETDIAVFIKISKSNKVNSKSPILSKDVKAENKVADIFMLNKECQLIQLMSNIRHSYQLLKVLNASTDTLYLFDAQNQCIDLYDLTHVTAVIDQRMLESRLITRLSSVNNFDPQNQIFKDGDYLYHLSKGQLIQIDIFQNKQVQINLGCQVSEVLAIQGNSVYFKTENFNIHFVDLDWLRQDRVNVSNVLTMKPIFKVQSVIFTRFEFDIIGNKIGTWVDPYVLKVFPPLNFNFLDCVGSYGAEQRMIAWNVDSGEPSQFEQTISALDPIRDEVITWSLGNGKITGVQSLGSNNYQGYKRHGEWNNTTIIYKVIPQIARDNTQKAIWRKVTVSNLKLVTVHKEFEHQFVRGRKLYVSQNNDLLLEFWDELIAMYSIQNGRTNRIFEEKNNFFQVNSPAYFSPDFRNYLAFEDTYTLNTNKIVVWQIKGNEKPEQNNNVQLPVMDQVVRIHERKPVITLLNSTTISYLDKDNVWIRCLIDKSTQIQPGQCQESYLTQEQTKHYLMMHVLNKNNTRISKLPFTQVLSMMVDQYKLRFKGQFDASELNLRFYSNNSFRMVSSFSFYHWRVIELIENNNISVKEINREILKELVNVILPDGEGVLHKLLRKNFEQFDEFIAVLGGQIKINILPNNFGHTPLHVCVQRSYSRAADLILQTVAKYPLDDHSSFIGDILKDLLVLCPVSLARYFESRVIKPEWGINQTRGQLKKTDQQCNFGVTSLPMKVTDEKILSKSLFVLDEQDDNQSSEDEMPQMLSSDKVQRIKVIGTDVQLQTTQQMNMPMTYEIIDFPGIHTFGTQLNREFLQTLAEQQDVESVFQTKFVRALLEYQLPRIKRVIFWKLLLPYLFYLFLFNFYAIWIFEQQKNGLPNSVTQNSMYYSSQGILLCFTMYFLWSEIRRFGGTQSIGQFFGNAWNIIDIVPLMLVTISILITLIPYTQSLIWQRYLNAVSLFLLWIKLLYFFRIERSFSSLINLITNVAKSMVTFLMILALAILAFAGSFYMLSQNNSPDQRFAPTYPLALRMAFELAVGNYDRTQFGTVGFIVVYAFFLIASLAVIIVMMNLLISIVSDTFNMMAGRQDITLYKEFSELIVDSYQMAYDTSSRSASNQSSNQYLCVTQVDSARLNNQELENRNRIHAALVQLESTVQVGHQRLELAQQVVKDTQTSERIGQLKESLAQMSNQVNQISKKLN